MEITGQIISFIVVGMSILSYQMKEKKTLLIIQTVGTLLNATQYLLIGAYAGFALNVVCVLRNVAFYATDDKTRYKCPTAILFACILGGVSIFSWEGYHSLLIIVGLIVNTLCLGICTAQGLRKSILLTCPMIFTYNVFVFSLGGLCNEALSFFSAFVGILRFRKEKSSHD